MSPTQQLICSVENGILVYAVRYALGRRGYTVSEVCKAVRENLTCLDAKIIYAVLRDIQQNADRFNLGDSDDVQNWELLRADLIKRLEETVGGYNPQDSAANLIDI